MARREVDLVIRARNEADRAVKAVSSALDDLKKAQESVQDSARGTDTSLGKIAATMQNLDRIVDKAADRTASSYSQVEAAIAKTSTALSTQKNRLAETKAQYASVEAQLKSAATAINRVEKELVSAALAGDNTRLSQLQAQWRGSENAVSELSRELTRLRGSLNAGQGELSETGAQLNRLKGAAAAAQIGMRQVETASASTASTLGRTRSQLMGTTAATYAAAGSMTQAARQGNRLRDAFQGVYGEGRRAMSFMQRIRGEVLAATTAFFGLYGAVNQIGQVLQALMTIEAIENRLGAVFNQDTARVTREMEWLEAQARRLGIELGVLGGQYAQFAIAADTANFSADATRDVFMSVAEAGRVMKLTNEQVEGTFYALQQMISKGKIQSEELRRQLGDRLPGAFQFMAEAVGVSTAELDAMLEQGELLADESTLLAFADVLTQRFSGQLPDALDATRTAIGRFENAILQARRQVAEAGFDEAFKNALNEITAFLESGDASQAFQSIGAALSHLVGILPEIVKNFDAIVKVGAAFVGLKLAQVMMGLSNVLGTRVVAQYRAAIVSVRGFNEALRQTATYSSGPVSKGLTAASAAMTRMNGAVVRLTASVRVLLAAVGGLPGIILTLLTFGAVEFFTRMGSAVDRANAALRSHERSMQRIRQAYEDAGGSVDDFQESLRDLSRTEAELELRKIEKALRDLRREALQTWIREESGIAGMDLGASRILKNDAWREVERLVYAFSRGEVSAEDFRSELDRLQQAGAGLSDGVLESLLDIANGTEEAGAGARELESAAEEARAAIRVLDGTASDADRALLGLGEALDEVSGSADTGAIDAYTNSIKELRGAVRELETMDDFRDQMRELRGARDGARDALNSDPEAMSDPALMAAGQAQIDQTYDSAVAELRRTLVSGVDFASIIDRTNPGADDETRRRAEEQLRDIASGLLERGVDLTRENILAANISGNLDDLETGRSQARATLDISDTEVERAEDLADARRRIAEAQANFNQSQDEANARSKYALDIANLHESEQQILLAIYDARADAQRQEIQFTDEQAAAIRRRLEDEQKLGALQHERRDGARSEKLSAQEMVGILDQRRQMIQEQIEFLREIGEFAQADELRAHLEATNQELLSAIEHAIVFWQTMGGAEAQNAVAELRSLQQQISLTGDRSVTSARQINESLAQGGANAFDQFSQSVAEGENALSAFANSFRQFAADFLRRIAMMIIQQQILNALQSFGGGGIGKGIASAVNAAAGVAHSGGMIGAGRPQRSVAAAYFSNAMRYHTGGIIGLKPNERPIIAEVGEEMLTRDDPRHRANGGGEKQADVKVYNYIDAGEMVSAGLGTSAGEQAVMNLINSNAGAVKRALS